MFSPRLINLSIYSLDGAKVDGQPRWYRLRMRCSTLGRRTARSRDRHEGAEDDNGDDGNSGDDVIDRTRNDGNGNAGPTSRRQQPNSSGSSSKSPRKTSTRGRRVDDDNDNTVCALFYSLYCNFYRWGI